MLQLSGPTLKFLLVIDQIWVNVELICSIKHSLQTATEGELRNPARFIRIGRVIVLCFILIFAIAVLALLVFYRITLEKEQRKQLVFEADKTYVLALQITAFTLLTATITVIFWYLSKLKDKSDDRQAFDKERRQLGTILIFFDISYFIRATTDFF